MDIESIPANDEEFRILQTRHHTQTAVIRLEPGRATSEDFSEHPCSEQTVIVLEGALQLEVGDETGVLNPGESLVIGAGVKHRLTNTGSRAVTAYTVYAPPVYPPALPRSVAHH